MELYLCMSSGEGTDKLFDIEDMVLVTEDEPDPITTLESGLYVIYGDYT